MAGGRFGGVRTHLRHNIVSAVALLLTLVLGVLVVLPVVYMLVNAFLHEGAFSFCHFAETLGDWRRVLSLAHTSALVVSGTVAVSVVLGVPFGFFCFRTDMPWRGAMVVCALLGVSIPLYITSAAWCALGGMPLWAASTLGAVWIQGVAFIPYAALISGVCFAHGDPDLEEAAMLDAGPWSAFLHVVLPQGAWGIVGAAIGIGILALADITVTDILMVRTWAEEVFVQWQLGEGPRRPMATAYPLILLVWLLAGLLWQTFRHHGASASPGGARRPRRIELGRARFAALGFCCLVVLLFLPVPILSLVRMTGSPGVFIQAVRDVYRELAVSVLVAPVAATLCCVLALPATRALSVPGWGRWVVGAIVIVLLTVPAPIVGIGVIKVFNRPGLLGWFYDSPGILVLTCCIRALPYTVLVLLPAVKRIQPQLADAAVLEGATWTAYLRFVLAPLCGRSLIIAWFLGFILSISELGASVLVAPPGLTTLSIRFFTLVHYGVYPNIAAMCLMLLAGVLLPGAAIACLLWKQLGRKYF